MQISRPHATTPTPQELRDLEKLKTVILQAIADGKLTGDEMQSIQRTAWIEGKARPEELHLISIMVTQKIREGELEWVWQ
ncbi:MAG: hypothetical protein IGS50_15380 [Synechococcales cyanobacterium C42_A2020_086]|jgi:uncharacterized membrane protein YebE (DUF533 family)|nr:hypothetical protein [Synechococcales cyanobacterium C42_A2020_086]